MQNVFKSKSKNKKGVKLDHIVLDRGLNNSIDVVYPKTVKNAMNV